MGTAVVAEDMVGRDVADVTETSVREAVAARQALVEGVVQVDPEDCSTLASRHNRRTHA